MRPKNGLSILVGLALTAFATAASAQAGRCHSGASFDGWLARFEQKAAAEGITSATLAQAKPYLVYDPGIVRRDRGQGVFQQSFLQFSSRMVNSRMQSGAARMRQNAGLLARIEKQFGVPGAAVVAFWGLETDFGADSGKLPVLRSLATLAYDCRRSELFTEELMYGLKVLQRGDLSADRMIGAWAGEIGQTQFSMSAYYKYAIDYDGSGHPDLIHSAADVLASSANLLAKEGWRRGEPWMQEVRVPDDMPWKEADLDIKHPRSQWAKWGVTGRDGRALAADGMQASLLLPMGRLGPAFLTFHNFDVYLQWNQSLVYATTAAYYATRLSGAPQVGRGRGSPPTLSARQITELQRALARLGYDPGTVDGKLGLTSRRAVKQAQLKFGLPADSYPTAELLARVRGGR